MIRKGELKEGDKLTGYLGTMEYPNYFTIIKNDYNNTLFIVQGKSKNDEHINSWDLINLKFAIKEKEKEYLTFDEARKSGKNFKYKCWDKHYSLSNVIKILSSSTYENINMNLIFDMKLWEVEN